jgi:hypothetical protein
VNEDTNKPEKIGNSEERNIPTIILCEETINDSASSYEEDNDSHKFKSEIFNRFDIGVANKYFVKNAELLTFAHEYSHLLWGHLSKNVKLWINRETQANFLASILINDPIASIYIQYKTNFQPSEYQRTMLAYNDFNIINFYEALTKVLILK